MVRYLDEIAEAQREEVASCWSHSKKMAKAGLELMAMSSNPALAIFLLCDQQEATSSLWASAISSRYRTTQVTLTVK